MATIYEHFESRQLGKDASTFAYIVSGYDNEYDAENALINYVPATLPNSQELDDWRITQRFREGAWRFSVTYKTPEIRNRLPKPIDAGEWSFSFNTTGGSALITQSLATRAYTSSGAASGKNDMFGQGINVTGDPPDLRAEGVQAVVPTLGFEIRAALPNSIITTTYARIISELTGRTNQAPFPPASMPFVTAQWGPEQVLFLGAVGSWKSSGDIELTFQFEAGEVTQNLSTGDITGIIKGPHEYLWFRYKKEDDTTNKKTVLKPEIAFVERVYDTGNLDRIFTG